MTYPYRAGGSKIPEIDAETRNAERARAAVNRIMPDIKLCQCAVCGKQARYYHHHSYTPENWINVIPVCGRCHRWIHGFPYRMASFFHQCYHYEQLTQLLNDTTSEKHEVLRFVRKLKAA